MIECYAGPADGEYLPMMPMAPLEQFPYVTMDAAEPYWYELRQDGTGTYHYVLSGALTPQWLPLDSNGTL